MVGLRDRRSCAIINEIYARLDKLADEGVLEVATLLPKLE